MEWIQELKNKLHSEVRTDPVSKAIYSTDASIFEVTPQAIVIPRNKNELLQAVAIASKYKVPMTARGAATGITGSCLGTGVVLDLSKQLTTIFDIDLDNHRVRCEPGLVQDDLNNAISPFGYRLGPDTSTGNRATLGGMVGNNAAGAHALKFGRMVDHVEEVELILATGEVIQCKTLTPNEWKEKCSQNNLEGHIYREISRIRRDFHDVIAREFPKVKRRASGYNLDELIQPGFCNLSKLIVGSEGTLGIISEVTVKIVPKPGFQAICLVSSDSLVEGLRRAHEYLRFSPYALELIDRKIIEAGRNSPSMLNKLNWLKGLPEALFAVEFEAESEQQLSEKCKQFQAINPQSTQIISDPEEQRQVWQLRKSGLGLLMSQRSYSRAIAFIEDIVVPPEKLASFISKLTEYLCREDKEAGIYGHVADGCLHVRPYMNLYTEKEKIERMMKQVGSIVTSFGGSMSAEHGDGRLRSWMNRSLYGENIYKVFEELKKAFDPENIMNPGCIVSQEKELTHLRAPQKTDFKPFMSFEREGGFHLAVDLCNGNGQCRKKTHLMCPSYQATHDEKDTTRARANSFRALLQGKLAPDALNSPEFHSVMDLCIQCKGCKTECPSQVDMAKIKSEYLHACHKKEGISFRDRLFGNLSTFFKAGRHLPSIANFFLRFKTVFSLFGISRKRTLPALSLKPFSSQFKSQKQSDKKVVLFNDTFTEFITPEIGLKAARLLEALGYEVIVPTYHCCGRTLISKGFLEKAKEKATQLVDLLFSYADQKLPIIGLEPSCLLTLKDEFRDLHLNKQKVDQIIQSATTIDEFLSLHTESLRTILQPFAKTILLHGHCHQKALVGMQPTLKVLHCIPGAKIEEIPSGCCGMAGSFGYEKEHYAISQKMGELELFPAIRNQKEAVVVASGTSCRTQIHDGTERHALHLVELLDMCLNKIERMNSEG